MIPHIFRQALRAKSGEWKWILSRGRIIERDQEGHPVRSVGTHLDITEARRATEILNRRNELLTSLSAALQTFISDSGSNQAFQNILRSFVEFSRSEAGLLCEIKRDPSGEIKPDQELAYVFERVETSSGPRVEADELRRIAGTFRELPFHLKEAQADTRLAPDECPLVKSLLALPVSRGDELLGMVLLANRPGGYTGEIPHEARLLLNTFGTMISKRHAVQQRNAARAELAEQKEQLAVTLASIGEAVIALDCSKRILFMNPSAERLTGLSLDEARSMPLAEAFSLFDTHGYPAENPVEKVHQTGMPHGNLYSIEHPLELRSHGLSQPSILAAAAPMRGADGTLTGFVLVLRDVGNELRADSAKRDFVSCVSHELRTPLTSIQGFVATILGDAEMPAELRTEFLAIIQEQAKRLGILVEDILEISKVESGRLRLTKEPVDLSTIVQTCVREMAPEAARKQLALKMEISSPFPTMTGDRSKLLSVVSNLLSNAIKFTPAQGRIKVSLDARQDELILEVSDTGYGIPPEDIPRVFEKFYRVERPDLQIPGAGLGLAIVQNIVLMHSGRVEVDSEVGSGTTFRVFLPLTEPADRLR
ncbi:MAG: PAS domain S-box protein [Verrucomicrobia bacterium]|nr:PAS domain S-box protein [Verrucomicrobiota bacterium]